MPQILELLAPARDLETAKAAVLAGADAIYIGGPAFSARSKAHNTLEDLEQICKFCHLFKVKVHVTLNILLEDEEFPEVQELIFSLAKIGVDAFIIEDLGILTLEIPEGLELHMSTQGNIDTLEKLEFVNNLGFSQVVLPREFSLAQIKAFHEAKPDLKLEVFVSGALCVGRSGVCRISEYLTGRSGNRGECAQICRVKMKLLKDGQEQAQGFLLNLKDNLRLENLEELVLSGVSSFKIEGRMKDALYVKNQTAAFSQKLNEIIKNSKGHFKRASLGEVNYNFTPDLTKTFNRGFTSEYLQGTNDNLVNLRSPKFMGSYIGKVKEVKEGRRGSTVIIKDLQEPIHNGDALSFINYEGDEEGFRVSEIKQISKTKFALGVRGHPEVFEELKLYRNYDHLFLSKLQREDSVSREVELFESLFLVESEGKPTLCLKVQDKAQRMAQALLEVTLSETEVTDLDKVQEKLFKCALPFCKVKDVQVEKKVSSVILPLSSLNALRREAQDLYFAKAQDKISTFKYQKPKVWPLYPQKTIDMRQVLSKRTCDFINFLGFNDKIKDKPLEARALMQCKVCLIKNHALCSKFGGKVTGFSLQVGGMEFPLVCDCKNCQMLVLEPKLKN